MPPTATGKNSKSRPGMQAHNARERGLSAQPFVHSSTIPGGLFIIALLGLVVALVGAGVLAISHLGNIVPPGCGPGSGCDEATASAWGTVPVVNWPTSHVGFAFFIAMSVAWFVSRHRGVTAGLIWLARIAAVASIGLTVVMFANGYLCKYCLLTHGGNLLFWVCAELAWRRAMGDAAVPLRTAIGVFVIATAALIPVEVYARTNAQQDVQKKQIEDVGNIINTPDAQRRIFTGRYLLGPEKAAIRIVALTDYQCPDCRNLEEELRTIMEQRQDVSLSVKQFPMSTKCNKYLDHDMHNNACMAARAAEAAGILYGNDGFWKMHFWLFDHGGEFTDAGFSGQLRELGFEPQQFINVMLSQGTLDLVQGDIEEGMSLGLFRTPMVFINGVEMRNAHVPGNLTRAITEISRHLPAPMTVQEAYDTPPSAEQKYVNDWKAMPQFDMPADEHSFPLGSDHPKLDIVVWGDYQESVSNDVNRAIRRRMKVQDGIRYHFRHFPVNKDCNEFAAQWGVNHPRACLAAQAVEAAGMLGQSDMWWRMHESMFLNSVSLRPELIKDVAGQLGLDGEVVMLYLNSQQVTDAIQEDCLAGKQRGLSSVPWVFINGRQVQRLSVNNRLGLDLIFDDVLGPLTEEQKQKLNGDANSGMSNRQQFKYTVDPEGK